MSSELCRKEARFGRASFNEIRACEVNSQQASVLQRSISQVLLESHLPLGLVGSTLP